jgi:hypothetical protein
LGHCTRDAAALPPGIMLPRHGSGAEASWIISGTSNAADIRDKRCLMLVRLYIWNEILPYTNSGKAYTCADQEQLTSNVSVALPMCCCGYSEAVYHTGAISCDCISYTCSSWRQRSTRGAVHDLSGTMGDKHIEVGGETPRLPYSLKIGVHHSSKCHHGFPKPGIAAVKATT